MKAPILPPSWIASLAFAAALLASSLAQAAVVDSPEAHHTWAASSLDHQQFYWDKDTGRFAVALTYTTDDYASRDNPPQSQTLLFHFPGVRHVAGEGRFVLDEGSGRTALVAHKVFLGSIKLADGNRLLIRRHGGTVRVALAVGE